MKKKVIDREITRLYVFELTVEAIRKTTSEKQLPEFIEENMILKDDLGIDSLDFVEVIMALEKELNISIPDIEAETIDLSGTVGNIVDLVTNICKYKIKHI